MNGIPYFIVPVMAIMGGILGYELLSSHHGYQRRFFCGLCFELIILLPFTSGW